jgi:uncharacterized protein YbjT (DUF2867 family)
MLLIVGASGMLGRQIAERALAAGRPLRLMARHPAKLADLGARGAQLVHGDLIDPPSLARACEGATQLIASAHALLGRGRNRSEAVDDAGHRALIDAARQAGVGHFVYISALGAAPDHPVDFFRTKYVIEEYLKASGLCWTILRPSAFMDLHAHRLIGMNIVATGKAKLIGKGSTRRNFIAVRDIARYVELALDEPKFRNRVLELGGTDNLTDDEITVLYGRLAGVTPKISRLPAGVAKVMSIVLKPFHPGISRVLYMGSLPQDAYPMTFDPAPLLAEFPEHLTTLEEYAREHLQSPNLCRPGSQVGFSSPESE